MKKQFIKLWFLLLMVFITGCNKNETNISEEINDFYINDSTGSQIDLDKEIEEYNGISVYKIVNTKYNASNITKTYGLYNTIEVDSTNSDMYEPIIEFEITFESNNKNSKIISLNFPMQYENEKKPYASYTMEMMNVLDHVIKSIFPSADNAKINRIKDTLNIPTPGEYIEIKTNKEYTNRNASVVGEEGNLTINYDKNENILTLKYERE